MGDTSHTEKSQCDSIFSKDINRIRGNRRTLAPGLAEYVPAAMCGTWVGFLSFLPSQL